jgi:hypothetical protein
VAGGCNEADGSDNDVLGGAESDGVTDDEGNGEIDGADVVDMDWDWDIDGVLDTIGVVEQEEVMDDEPEALWLPDGVREEVTDADTLGVAVGEMVTDGEPDKLVLDVADGAKDTLTDGVGDGGDDCDCVMDHVADGDTDDVADGVTDNDIDVVMDEVMDGVADGDDFGVRDWDWDWDRDRDPDGVPDTVGVVEEEEVMDDGPEALWLPDAVLDTVADMDPEGDVDGGGD